MFQNKTIVITGSSIGIGRTLARNLAQQGAKIVLNARNAERLEKTRLALSEEGYDVLAVAGDVSKIEDCEHLIKATVDHFGGLDVLINNAGISMEGAVADLHPDVFRKVMEVNYLGSVYPTQAALPHLQASKGSVIFIGSAAGIRGIPGYAVYSSSKMSLTALAEALRTELYESGVHVGLAYVGFTQNDPEKTIYNAKGEIIPQPNRSFIKAESPERVAERIMRMIKKRQFKRVFTPLGQLNAVMNRFFPGIVDGILRRNYLKRGRKS